ncbi:hypothetical protein AALO_G00033990 [Alosa alosa]|uniref:Uncharacterized protein n=1 Tax=Alosa alosa TaxID=278164 RepID=A0AAV6HFU7_9TELE|nr:hypothetical protein AALO_G00033990 [Alosa alosa]
MQNRRMVSPPTTGFSLNEQCRSRKCDGGSFPLFLLHLWIPSEDSSFAKCNNTHIYCQPVPIPCCRRRLGAR